MAAPQAVNTFNFFTHNLNTYESGSWSAADLFFDNITHTPGSGLETVSAGALTSALAAHKGVFGISQDFGSTQGMVWVGNGLPGSVYPIQCPTLPSTVASQPFINTNFGTSCGGWHYNNKDWIIAQVYDGISTSKWAVLSCADPSVLNTWTIEDSFAHSPDVVLTRGLVEYDVDNQIIYLFTVTVNTSPRQYALFKFNLNTGLWSGPTHTLIPGGGISLDFRGFNVTDLTNGLVLFPNNDIGIFYTDGTGLKYRLYDDGLAAWQTPAVIDSDGRFGNLIYDRTSPDPMYLVWGLVSDSFASPRLSTVTKAGVGSLEFSYPTGGGYQDGVGHMCIAGGSLFVPLDQNRASNSDRFFSNVWDAPIGSLSSMTRRALPKRVDDGAATAPTCNFMIFGQGSEPTAESLTLGMEMDVTFGVTRHPEPPSPGGGECSGVWELRRVDVTLKPAPHIPVRGS